MITSDIWFAAFLRLKGYKLTNFEIIGRGKGKYEFEIDSESWKTERLEFFQSEISRAKQTIEELKDLLY